MCEADLQDLRDRLVRALTREHYRRSAERISASPEEHQAAFADVAMREFRQMMAESRERRRTKMCSGAEMEALQAVLDGDEEHADALLDAMEDERLHTLFVRLSRLLSLVEVKAACIDSTPKPAHRGRHRRS